MTPTEQLNLLERRMANISKRLARLEMQANPAPKRKGKYVPKLKGKVYPGMPKAEIHNLIHERHIAKAAKKKAA